VQKYCERRGAAHVTVGVSVACKLMRACSRDLPQLLGSLRQLTSFLLLHASTWCNVQGMLLLHEFAEHRHSSTSALLHTFNADVCALMAKDAAAQPADVAAVHGALAPRRLLHIVIRLQRLPSTPQHFWSRSCATPAAPLQMPSRSKF
jgi:hypothetical protein